jgi:hypothetical protein
MASQATAGCAMRISVPRRSGWCTWLPLRRETGLLRWS